MDESERENPNKLPFPSNLPVAKADTDDQIPEDMSDKRDWFAERAMLLDEPPKRLENAVITEVQDHDGNRQGFVVARHDGTREGIQNAAWITRARADWRLGPYRYSNMMSRTIATLDKGTPALAVSPNYKNVVPIDSTHGRGILRDAEAVHKMYGDDAPPLDREGDLPERENPSSSKGVWATLAALGGGLFLGAFLSSDDNT